MPRRLDRLLRPRTLALIGGSSRPGSPGTLLVNNIVAHAFPGEVFVVNPKYDRVGELGCVASVRELPQPVDLAIVCTPARTVRSIIDECGQAGIKGIVLLTPGSESDPRRRRKWYQKLRRRAEKHDIRLLGPSAYGLVNTHAQLFATLATFPVHRGKLALITQSGPLGGAILDWAADHRVGFSHVFSLGEMLDIDHADLIEYLGTDGNTNCILIYMEDLRRARRFMSAARSFARSKPIIILKSGREPMFLPAGVQDTLEVPPSPDAVFSAAFVRAGLLRVNKVSQLFFCAQALTGQPRPKGSTLAIVSNALGPGLLASDYLIANGGQAGTLSAENRQALTEQDILVRAYPQRTSAPVIVLSRRAGPEAYEQVVQRVAQQQDVDGVLVVYAPQPAGDPAEIAARIGALAAQLNQPVYASWLGERTVATSREALEQAGVPEFRFPESAVDTFLRIYHYERNLRLLQETPPAIPLEQDFDRAAVSAAIDHLRARGLRHAPETVAREILAAYRLPVNPFELTTNAKAAVAAAERLGYPVAVKVISPDIRSKTAVDGIRLDLPDAAAVRRAFRAVKRSAKAALPQAKLSGVSVEPMVDDRTELLIAARRDPTFGPVVLFGRGGLTATIQPDVAIALPPLNLALAERLVASTQIATLLRGFRHHPAIDLAALYQLLVRFSYLLSDFPDIETLSINPLVVNAGRLVCLDADLRLTATPQSITPTFDHLVIPPYPARYTTTRTLRDGRQVVLRAIRPEDEPLVEAMLEESSRETLYYRFFGQIPKISHQFLTRFTQIDYDREMAIIGLLPAEEGRGHKMIGVVRLVADAWRESAEYAIAVADPYQRSGLGTLLTDYILDIARDMNLRLVTAEVLAENTPMLKLFAKFGFERKRIDYETYHVEKTL
jgi:acetyltransferase